LASENDFVCEVIPARAKRQLVSYRRAVAEGGKSRFGAGGCFSREVIPARAKGRFGEPE